VLRRVAYAVEAIVSVALIVTVVLLFTNDSQPAASTPGAPATAVDAYGLPVGADSDGSGPAAAPGPDGAAIYAENCSSCHGASGEGGLGPAIADGRTVAMFPDAADQAVFVSNGLGAMPAFAGQLSAEQIAAVVDFVRERLVSE
jgi:mono/diheme cytochrome c family protein